MTTTSVDTDCIDQLFQPYDRPDSPGWSLAILQDGEVVYARGYGMANLEHDIPIGPETVFHVASVSKQFTAMAIALLAHRGTVDLDADIRTYLPEVPDFGPSVTVRHLIHHTSGIRDQWDLLSMTGWRFEDVVTNQDVLDLVVDQRALNFAPGDEHLYSNSGYTLLALIVERVTGRSFRQFTQEAIFAPLGMTRTLFHDNHDEIVKGRTSGYEVRNDQVEVSNPQYSTVGASTLFTTASDLVRWVDGLQHARLGGPDVIDLITTRGVLNDGTTLDYAFGLNTAPYRGVRRISHAGGDTGYRSFLAWFPDQRFGVAVLANLGTVSPNQLAMQVADIWLEGNFSQPSPFVSDEQEAVTLPVEALRRHAGLYRDPKSRRVVRVSVENGSLVLGLGQPTRFAPVTPDRFHLAAMNMDAEFSTVEGTHRLQLLLGREPFITIERISEDEVERPNLAEYAGSYSSPELDITYRIELRDEGLILRRRRRDDAPLQPSVPDELATDSMDVLAFSRDEQGEITGFGLYTMRTRNLRFERV